MLGLGWTWKRPPKEAMATAALWEMFVGAKWILDLWQ
jgi:hypothetical protein